MARGGCWVRWMWMPLLPATTCFGGIWAPTNERAATRRLLPGRACSRQTTLLALGTASAIWGGRWAAAALGQAASRAASRNRHAARPPLPAARRATESTPKPKPALRSALCAHPHPHTHTPTLSLLRIRTRSPCTHARMHRRPASHSQRRPPSRRLGLPGLVCRHGGLRQRREMKKKGKKPL